MSSAHVTRTDQLVDDNKQNSKLRFGLLSATCLVIANMIGTGVFTTSGFSLAGIGNRQWVMLAWCIGGFIAICGAISYGKLSRLISESGGEYLYLSRMLHPSIGFIAGWVSLLAGFSAAIAISAIAFESYAVEALVLPQWYLKGAIAVGLIAIFGLLHALQVRTGVWTQNVVIAIKIALILGLVTVAAFADPDRWTGLKSDDPETPFSIYSLASQLVWISFSFCGFNCAVYIAGEIRNPKQNVFWSMVIGTTLVTVLYLCLNFIFLYAPAYNDVVGQERVATIAAVAIGGDGFATLVRIIILIALCSSVSSMIVAGPRVYAQMASDGVFPRFFQGIDKGGVFTPANAVWLQVGLAVVFVIFTGLQSLLNYLSFTLSVSAAITVCCLFVAQYKKRKMTVVGMIAPTIYVVATLGLGALAVLQDHWNGEYSKLIAFIVTIASGFCLYLLFRGTSQLKPETKNEIQ